jgi:hypothetical protein
MGAQRILEQSGLDWQSVRMQYDVRADISRRLIRLTNANPSSEFAQLALGITDPNGNYSARERSLGPRILAENQNAAERVMRLARAFSGLQDGEEVMDELRRAGIINLGIAVGSELACLINPAVCWITNRRTVWTDFLIRNRGNYQSANEAIRISAEQGWTDFHRETRRTLVSLADAGRILTQAADVLPGDLIFLWADAIANQLYEDHYR